LPMRTDYRFCITGKCLEFTKWCSLPVDRTKNDRDYTCLSTFVPLHCFLHFDAIGILGVHEIRTNQQENDICFIQLLVYFLFPLGPCTNVSIMPYIDEALS